MNVKRLEGHLRGASLDLEVLRLVAAEVADGLVERSAAELKRVREALALARAEGEAATYREALDDVLAAFTKEVAQREDLRAARAVAERYRGLVAELVEGPRTPTELSAKLNRDKAQVSRNLEKLEQAGIVEVLGAAKDGRERPRRLTLRGQELAQELGIAHESIPQEVARSLDCATTILASVVVEQTVSLERLVKIAERSLAGLKVDPEAVLERVVAQAEEHGLLRRDKNLACVDEAFELVPEIQHRIEESVNKGERPDFWNQVMHAAGDPQVKILLRAASDSRRPWNNFFVLEDLCGEVLGAADLEHQLFDSSEPYVLIYESLALLKADQCQIEAVEDVASKAQKRFFLADSASEPQVFGSFVPLGISVGVGPGREAVA